MEILLNYKVFINIDKNACKNMTGRTNKNTQLEVSIVLLVNAINI